LFIDLAGVINPASSQQGGRKKKSDAIRGDISAVMNETKEKKKETRKVKNLKSRIANFKEQGAEKDKAIKTLEIALVTKTAETSTAEHEASLLSIRRQAELDGAKITSTLAAHVTEYIERTTLEEQNASVRKAQEEKEDAEDAAAATAIRRRAERANTKRLLADQDRRASALEKKQRKAENEAKRARLTGASSDDESE
jgi:hypothetical protein